MRWLTAVGLAVLPVVSASAKEKTEDAAPKRPPAASKTVDFVRDVEPIFAKHCYDCHGEFAAEAKLRLDAKHIVMRGGVSGPLFEVGKSGESLLIERLIGAGGEDRMPLDADPLTDAEIGIVRAWIDQGAKWPDGVGSDVRQLERHWAYVKPQRPELPQVKSEDWCRNPIDFFVLKRLEDAGLQPSPDLGESRPLSPKADRPHSASADDSDRAKLLRRVSLDLTGLPPTVAEVEAFVNDTRPDAYERVVERLLASKRFGEKWARPWLDLARYADSNGFQADQYREVWPYRDWVIDAINADVPFDRFSVEQIAGDLLPNATREQRIATGFHRQTTCNVEAGVDPEENRVNQVFDRVNTTGLVWLGTSIECTQCHGHPYDPFSQRDYYRLFAFYNNTPLEVKHGSGTRYDFFGPKMPIEMTDEQRSKRERLQDSKQRLEEELAALTAKLVETELPAWEERQRKQLAQLDAAAEAGSGWQVLDVVDFESKEGASHEVLEDGSVLLSGKNAATDTYTVAVRTELSAITAFKLETLTHDSLPEKGPGRRSPRANFVLQDFRVTAKPASGDDESPVRVELHGAKADYAQSQYPVAGAIDDDPQSGWAIHSEFGKPHWATFRTKSPAGFEEGTTLDFTLAQNHGGQRTIGRLRLLACEGQPPADEVASPAAIPEAVANALRTPRDERTAMGQAAIEDRFLDAHDDVKQLREKVAAVEKQLESVEPPTTLVMVEMDEQRETHLFERGNFLSPGKQVDAGTPSQLHAFPEDLPRDRLGLAKWLVSEENPLVARVTVNRWWAEMFGEGIVRTEEDFGTQAEPPTHPELLDWLAVEFVESGWSMKHVLKTIVTSATYRQSSAVTPELLERDPENRLLARMSRFRLPAEIVRDNALAVSGLLSEKMHGPPVYPPQPSGIWRHVGRNAPKYDTDTDEDRFRRGIYVVWRRSAPYPSFVNFDAPDRAACVVQRPRTNTPLQALTLLNDEAYVEMAFALARKVATNDDLASDRDRVDYAFRSCVARPPNDRERDAIEALFREQLDRFRDDPSATKQLLGEANVPQDLAPEELAAWFFVSNALLNLDETITKP